MGEFDDYWAYKGDSGMPHSDHQRLVSTWIGAFALGAAACIYHHASSLASHLKSLPHRHTGMSVGDGYLRVTGMGEVLYPSPFAGKPMGKFWADGHGYGRALLAPVASDCHPSWVYQRGNVERRPWLGGADECVDPVSDPLQHSEHLQQEEEVDPQGMHFCEMCGGFDD